MKLFVFSLTAAFLCGGWLLPAGVQAFTTPSVVSVPASSSTALSMSKDFDLVRGFESICLHAGYLPDPTTTSRGVPLHRTAPYVFKDTETAANLFGLKELGNIYSTYRLNLFERLCCHKMRGVDAIYPLTVD